MFRRKSSNQNDLDLWGVQGGHPLLHSVVLKPGLGWTTIVNRSADVGVQGGTAPFTISVVFLNAMRGQRFKIRVVEEYPLKRELIVGPSESIILPRSDDPDNIIKGPLGIGLVIELLDVSIQKPNTNQPEMVIVNDIPANTGRILMLACVYRGFPVTVQMLAEDGVEKPIFYYVSDN